MLPQLSGVESTNMYFLFPSGGPRLAAGLRPGESPTSSFRQPPTRSSHTCRMEKGILVATAEGYCASEPAWIIFNATR